MVRGESSAILISTVVQFNYSLLTPSQRKSARESAAARWPTWLGSAEAWVPSSRPGVTDQYAACAHFRARSPARTGAQEPVVVSPMAQYKAVDGTPTDWHLVPLRPSAPRAGSGAFVYIEMTCVSQRGASRRGVRVSLSSGTRGAVEASR